MLHFYGQNIVAVWSAVKITKTTDLNKCEVWHKSDVTTTAYWEKCTLINIFTHHQFYYVKSQQHFSRKGIFSEFLL
jgi:hypothetical protein